MPEAEPAETPAQLAERVKRWNADLIAAARVDFNAFAELVAVDDETGEPIKQATIHHKWAALCDRYPKLIIWSHINSGKTSQLSILRTVWELGGDPTLRFAILSNTAGISTKIVRAISNYIKNNAKVREIFPHLAPDPEGPWTNTELKVVRNNDAKDPSVRAVGVHGALTSGRVDRLIVDDILDPENTDTEINRKSLEAWYKAVAVGRRSRRARILVVGTAYHPRDLLHTLAAKKGWKWVRFPIIDDAGKITWPEAWSPERIAEMREELGPAEFARQMLCQARDDGEARFKQSWIDAAIARGEGLRMVHSLADLPGNSPEDPVANPYGELPEGCRTFTGVDLATGKKVKKKANDDTVFFTFLQDAKGERTILNIEIGKFTGPQIIKKLEDLYRRYQQTAIVVENNGSQDFILQFAEDGLNIPVVPFTTSAAKRDPILGVEGFAVELSNGKWIFPSESTKVSAQLDRLISEMLFFSPSTHTGDVLMAVYFARDYARRLLGNVSGPTVSVTVVGERPAPTDADGSEPGELERLFVVPARKERVAVAA